ncbi:SAV_2336 N-terminal domain-related protein [Micromonospora sp. DT53]|uniref:SAV_2336 N-terminal domain-related protein n=1 Tax=Micromonospora sp. DT53 TaxID=3393444 RepID=UPI003CEF8F8A
MGARDSLELAELLWLARLRFPGDRPSMPGPGESRAAEVSARSGPAPVAAPSPETPPSERTQASGDGMGPTHGDHDPQPAETAGNDESIIVRSPAFSNLPATLSLMGALRPINRRRSGHGSSVLDEDATARHRADSGFWWPVLRPADRRWLDLLIVSDQSRSMILWQPLAGELRTLLQRSGLFRTVRHRYLHARGDRLVVSADAEGHRPVSRFASSDPVAPCAVVVITDAVDPSWRTPAAGTLLRQWSDEAPTVILQPLPQRLWKRTALAVEVGQLTPATAAAPNRAMTIDGHAVSGAAAVPIFHVGADWLSDWAAFLAGRAIPQAAVVPLSDSWAVEGLNPDPRENDGDPVGRFLATASPVAARLAARLAAVGPLTVPVMNYVRRTTMPGAGLEHLAEVLLSGLMRPVALLGQPGPEETEFEFRPSIGARLMDGLRQSQIAHVIDTVYDAYLRQDLGPGPDENGRPARYGRPLRLRTGPLIEATRRTRGHLESARRANSRDRHGRGTAWPEPPRLSPEDPVDAMRRVIARDDLLRVSIEAETALAVVLQRAESGRPSMEDNPFQVALEIHLRAAANDKRWHTRARALDAAAAIVQFCSLFFILLESPVDVSELRARSLREIGDPPDIKDLTLGVILRYRAARDLRIAGRLRDAADMVGNGNWTAGTGADAYADYLAFERIATSIAAGTVGRADTLIFGDMPRSGRPSLARHRIHLAQALVAWAQEDREATGRHLDRAQSTVEASPGDDDSSLIERLSVTLAAAEQLVLGDSNDERTDAVRLGESALALLGRLRREHAVVIGSTRAPLTLAIERIHGDLALLAARLPGDRAAALGLLTSLAAKDSLTEGRIRVDSKPMGGRVAAIVEEIQDVEFAASDAGHERRDQLRFELEQAVSPMLADMVLPFPPSLDRLTDAIGSRYALDYVALHDTMGATRSWFRAILRPGGHATFEHFPEPSNDWSAEHRADKDLAGRLDAAALLPDGLLQRLSELDRTRPLQLLISPFGGLQTVPWPALAIDRNGTRLIERAALAFSPSLTSIIEPDAPAVAGEALIHLVGRNEGGVNVNAERAAWGLPHGRASVPLFRCPISSTAMPEPINRRLREVLASRSAAWGFAHIACNAAGRGIDQTLHLGGDNIVAAEAMGMHWPSSVLLATDGPGWSPDHPHDLPAGQAVSMLVGGARCVVAAVGTPTDNGAGRLAAHIVRQVRYQTTNLVDALRRAQLDALDKGVPRPADWAVFMAFVR